MRATPRTRRLTRVQLQLAADLCTAHGENAENALVPTRRSFGGDPEEERDEDRKYDVIPYAFRERAERGPEETVLSRVSAISARRYVRGVASDRECFVLDQ